MMESNINTKMNIFILDANKNIIGEAIASEIYLKNQEEEYETGKGKTMVFKDPHLYIVTNTYSNKEEEELYAYKKAFKKFVKHMYELGIDPFEQLIDNEEDRRTLSDSINRKRSLTDGLIEFYLKKYREAT